MDLLPRIYTPLDLGITVALAVLCSLVIARLVLGRLGFGAMTIHMCLGVVFAFGGMQAVSLLGAPLWIALSAALLGATMAASLAYSVHPARGFAATALAWIVWLAVLNSVA